MALEVNFNMLVVQKFGGSSLASPERIQVAAKRCCDLVQEGHQVVSVVSAQGDTTDDLLEKVRTFSPNLRELDAYLSAGEQLSAALMAMAIQDQGCKAISLTGWQAGLETDENHADARILGLSGDRIHRELNEGKIVVVAGFQGIGPSGDITTLGRGGSDTTAVALAAFLSAGICRIFTDVDGVYDKDPRLHPDAVKYRKLGYEEMLALARSGAQVLHDRSVELAQKYRVPVQVLSSFRPGPGTMVMDTHLDSSQS